MAKGIPSHDPMQRSIPHQLARPAGHIIIKWAYIEVRLSTMIWQLMGINEEVGRIAVREPRAKDRLSMIRTLLSLKGIEISNDIHRKFYNQLEKIEEVRNAIAHGVWVKRGRRWGIIRTGGKAPEFNESLAQRKREVRPEFQACTPDGLNAVVKALDSAIKTLDSLAQVVSSHSTPHAKQPPSSHSPALRRMKKRYTPPESSRE